MVDSHHLAEETLVVAVAVQMAAEAADKLSFNRTVVKRSLVLPRMTHNKAPQWNLENYLSMKAW